MQFRLWHILGLMGLILLAGVLSVRELEAHVGRTTVPGIVIIDVPDMDLAAAEATVRRWAGALLQWAPADAEPLSPFDPETVRRLRERGHASALLVAREADFGVAASTTQSPIGPSEAGEELRDAWGVLVTELGPEQAAVSLADFVRSCDGFRPFVLGLQLHAPSVPELVAAVARQVDAAEELPAFRHTAIVVLGMREPQSGRRLAVRVDRGDLQGMPPPALKDLLPVPR